MKFVLISAGRFEMGGGISPEKVVRRYGGEAKWFRCEYPRHEVKIEQPFYLQTTPVTQNQWRCVMGKNPSNFSDCGDDCPVEWVSWDDVQEFIKKLNEKEYTDRYLLPTEAEWEYACRAGSTTEYFFGDDVHTLSDYAWYSANSSDRTHPVAQKKANEWGLYDMHGNVWEWVADDWHSTYEEAPADGRAWIDAPRSTDRVIRGGGWDVYALSCRSATRTCDAPVICSASIGFRLARSVTLGP